MAAPLPTFVLDDTPTPCAACGAVAPKHLMTFWVDFDGTHGPPFCFGCASRVPLQIVDVKRRLDELERLLTPDVVVPATE